MMSETFPASVGKIVADYLERLRGHLKGVNAKDQDDLLREIESHIYESFRNRSEKDEVERILAVLRHLGEPAEVVSSRLPAAMVDMGRKKKLPMYILAGVLIALVGLPLGGSALGLIFGMLGGLLGFLIGYFAVAISLVFAGLVGMVVSFIYLVSPTFIYKLVGWLGGEYVQIGHIPGLLHNPTLEAIIALIASLVLAGLGLLMLWGGKHILRGLSFPFNWTMEKVRSLTKKK